MYVLLASEFAGIYFSTVNPLSASASGGTSYSNKSVSNTYGLNSAGNANNLPLSNTTSNRCSCILCGSISMACFCYVFGEDCFAEERKMKMYSTALGRDESDWLCAHYVLLH